MGYSRGISGHVDCHAFGVTVAHLRVVACCFCPRMRIGGLTAIYTE